MSDFWFRIYAIWDTWVWRFNSWRYREHNQAIEEAEDCD